MMPSYHLKREWSPCARLIQAKRTPIVQTAVDIDVTWEGVQYRYTEPVTLRGLYGLSRNPDIIVY